MYRNWLEPADTYVPLSFIQSIGGNPLVSNLLYQRGITDTDAGRAFLLPEFYQPTSALQIPGVEEITEILLAEIESNKKIGIWGDFDVDGQTATTIFYSALRDLGGNVIFHIPIRFSESHGINLIALRQFIDQGVEIILTCDTGISSHQAIEYAQEQGIPVLVTDHHDIPTELPKADVIVNPKVLPVEHPLSSLPGVGVVYKVVEQLFYKKRKDQEAIQYLDLVALGIVADVATLKGDTRYLLQRGLNTLRTSKRLGLRAIMELCELDQANLTEEHISFFLAPRLNAIGRLHDANQIVELLTTSDIGRARILALQLEGMNAQRKLLCDQVYQAAQAQLSMDPKLLENPILVLSHPSWPAGVIGIVASRLMEQYHQPVILFSTPPGVDARGSARSIETINITAAIAANRNLVKEFGGHPMAAGLSIDQNLIPEFREAISHTILAIGGGTNKENNLQINEYLSLPELSLNLVQEIERLAPFGAGNPPLIFATRNLKLTGYTAVGRNDDHLQVTIEDELGNSQRAIWWQGAGNTLPESTFDLAYSVRASTYHSQKDVQVEWVDYRRVEAPAIRMASKHRSIKVIDLRNESRPVDKITQIQTEETILIWGEAYTQSSATGLDRYSLYSSDILAIWTIPPGFYELREAINRVKPKKVYLFGTNVGMDEPERFLKRLFGLLKYSIKNSDGNTSLSSLAAATAQKISTIKIGLEWLESRGHISIKSMTDDDIVVQPGFKTFNKDTQAISMLLNTALNESAAFRRYFLTVDAEHLIFYE